MARSSTTVRGRRHARPANPVTPAPPRRRWPLIAALAVLVAAAALLTPYVDIGSGSSQPRTGSASSSAPRLTSPIPTSELPALTGRVVDIADILGAGRGELVSKLAALEAKTTDQLVVATVRSLNGRSVEDYANALFRHWGLGQRDKNNGVLLLIATGERKIRIEVGYGLEATLTDAVTKLIITNSIAPHLKANDMIGGVEAGVDDIIKVLTGDAGEWQRRASAHQSGIADHVGGIFAKIGTFFLVLVFLAVFGLFFFAMGFVAVALLVHFLVWIHLLPKRADRTGSWTILNYIDPGASSAGSSRSSSSSDSSWSSSSSGSSSSSDSFSGDGGSSGGGGSSGDY